MTNQTYNYVLVAHDGENFFPVYSSNHRTVDQLENKENPESPDWDWRISPSHLLKKLEGNRWGWNMYLLTVPALNF